MLGYPAPARKAPTSLSAKHDKNFIVENKLKVLKKNMARNQSSHNAANSAENSDIKAILPEIKTAEKNRTPEKIKNERSWVSGHVNTHNHKIRAQEAKSKKRSSVNKLKKDHS